MNGLNLGISPIQRAFGWCEKVRILRELHSGVAALKQSRCGRVSPLQLLRSGYLYADKLRWYHEVISSSDSNISVRGFFYMNKNPNLKSHITTLVILILFILLLILFYCKSIPIFIGYIAVAIVIACHVSTILKERKSDRKAEKLCLM